VSIRWKLLLLLLGIALVPLAVVGWHARSTIRSLGTNIAAQERETLTRELTERLRVTVEDRADLIRAQKTLVELALERIATEAEGRLALREPTGAPVYFAHQFDGVGQPQPGLHPSERHLRVGTKGKPEPKPISLDAVNIVLAPGVAANTVSDDIDRMATMLPAYKGLYARQPDLLFWMYTALESGVHVSFPGHGGYPEGYDPRYRPWYELAKQTGERRWSAPIVDATTRRLILTLSMPIKGPDGNFAGVTALDVQILDIFERVARGPATSTEAETYLVDHAARGGGGVGTGVRVIAHRSYEASDWRAAIEMNWLSSDDAEVFEQMKADIAALRSGLYRMPFEGQDSLWAFAPVDDQTATLLFIVPFSGILDEVAAVEKLVANQTTAHLGISAAMAVVMIIIVSVIAIFASRAVTDPARALAAAAEQIAEGDFEARAEVSGTDEIGRLAERFNAMIPQLEDRMRVRDALTVAMEVQQHLLPATAPVVPGFDIAGHSIYCEDTGGDYYDFIDLSDVGEGCVGIAVGDVSGHGVAAALLMTTVRALLRSRALRPGSVEPGTLGVLMTEINHQLANDVHRGRFMTLVYIVLESETGTLRWINAGHDPMTVNDPETGAFNELTAVGIPLGIEPDWTYEEQTAPFNRPGSVLIAGTDGFWETRNAEGVVFGKEAMFDVIRSHADRSASEICHAVHAALAAFRGDVQAADDVTLVVIKVAS